MYIEQKQDKILKPTSVYTKSAQEDNQITTELQNLITEGGLTPSANDLTQIKTAVQNMINQSGGSGGGKQIGEVYFSASSSSVDNPGGLPLFTGETIANADQLYPDFYDWVADHSELQISAANYETALSTYGECPKYVIDTTNHTIRLPKLVNYLKMANANNGITQASAGLPNITGTTTRTGMGYGSNASVYTGAFSTSVSGTGSDVQGGSDNTPGHFNGQLKFSASNSNSIYGNSTTVTPAHTTLFPWVCAYNAAVPASTAQAAEFQQALSGKADTNLGNISGTATKSIDGQWVTAYLSVIDSQITVSSGTYNDYDLSSYLPNDAYNYEILGYITCVTGSTNGNMADIYVISPGIITSGMRVCRAVTRTSNTSTATGSFILPIGSQRKIRVGNYAQNDCSVSYFRLMGYRRIGTNA